MAYTPPNAAPIPHYHARDNYGYVDRGFHWLKFDGSYVEVDGTAELET